ncbi:uracil-DNA glycosylase [Haloarculaceae archaeon H-GB2-1]|nr:uracil-DNA glycosylase [Haloarculaceae archaeon H-GB1-1]MEA5389489.1 uracil-DNA glycosylase [Haloarculaceae archaeon H-GB11]MEA5410058.1 uracil-DNA glycosylase [Haloarculaceae archaeon H-GB2-1]
MEDFESAFAEQLRAVPERFRDESRFVPGAGRWDAAVVFVGEAPGSEEVEQGQPFVGPAGRRLDGFLDEVGIDRDDVYLTNLVKVRSPENRDPTREEMDAWRPLLDAELERVDPAVVVCLGAFASRELLGESGPLSELRGRTYEVDDHLVLPTFHPAATFYDDSITPMLERDLRVAADLGADS